MQIRILWVGKTKNPSIKTLIADYLGRIHHLIPCEIVEIRDLSKGRSLGAVQLIAAEGEEIAKNLPNAGKVVALDETGSQYTSEGFARWLESEQNAGTKTISFVIGGPEGLSPTLAQRARMVLSMGKMTWTHEMCRVLLLEQVYRALCIMRNIPYHRGN